MRINDEVSLKQDGYIAHPRILILDIVVIISWF